MAHLSKLTTKSQITIPKDVRAVLGVGPGGMVSFAVGVDGQVTLARAEPDQAIEQRRADFVNRVREARKWFKDHDTQPGMDGLAYQRWIRGDGPSA